MLQFYEKFTWMQKEKKQQKLIDIRNKAGYLVNIEVLVYILFMQRRLEKLAKASFHSLSSPEKMRPHFTLYTVKRSQSETKRPTTESCLIGKTLGCIR